MRMCGPRVLEKVHLLFPTSDQPCPLSVPSYSLHSFFLCLRTNYPGSFFQQFQPRFKSLALQSFFPSVKSHINSDPEMASLMGSDVTSSGLRFQFGDRIRPIGMRLMEMRAAGKDAKDLDLDSLHSAKGRRCQIYFRLVTAQPIWQHILSHLLTPIRYQQILWPRQYRGWYPVPIP